MKAPLNSNWEQILKCQGQLQGDSVLVSGLEILVRLGKQGERSYPPAVQVEINSCKRSHLKPATPLLPPTGSLAGLPQFHAAHSPLSPLPGLCHELKEHELKTMCSWGTPGILPAWQMFTSQSPTLLTSAMGMMASIFPGCFVTRYLYI